MKRFLSLLLTVCIALSCVVTAFAAPAEDRDCGHYPVIIVAGVGAQPFLQDAGTENERVCFPPSVEVGPIVKKAVLGTLRAMFTLSLTNFAKTASEIVLDILGVICCDENGDSLYSVTHIPYDKAMSEYDPALYKDAEDCELAMVNAAVVAVGADHAYFYNYDWRLDPMQNIDKMNAFIDTVCAETGHNKVRLAACSMGGVQTTAYLQKYGSEKIDTIWFMSAAYYGLMFVSNVFTGELIVNQKALFTWLGTIETQNAKLNKFLWKLFDFCGRTVLLKPLFALTNKMLAPMNEVIIDNAMKQLFGNNPGMWAFVRDEQYEKAKQTLLTDAKPEYIAMLDNYHYNVQNHREEILLQAKADGVKIHVFSHYNNGNVPITSSAFEHGDNLIETVCTSAGATVAKMGETLPADYKQAECLAHNHISGDRIIDASTALFPDSTWFIKNMDHVGCKNGSAYWDFLCWMFRQTEQITIFDNANYPQFLETDRVTQMDLKIVRS